MDLHYTKSCTTSPNGRLGSVDDLDHDLSDLSVRRSLGIKAEFFFERFLTDVASKWHFRRRIVSGPRLFVKFSLLRWFED